MNSGQDVLLSVAGVPVAGLRAQSFKRNAVAIDMRDRNSAGRQVFVPGRVSSAALELSVSGVSKDASFRAAALGPTAGFFLARASLAFPAWGTIWGGFFLSDVSCDGGYEDAVLFSATLASNKAWIFTRPGEIEPAPAGYSLVVDGDGSFLTDGQGAYLIAPE